MLLTSTAAVEFGPHGDVPVPRSGVDTNETSPNCSLKSIDNNYMSVGVSLEYLNTDK